jgi:hypothetical protein
MYAVHLVNEIRVLFPHLEVRILDLTRPDNKKPASVFAVPTYVLDDTRIWLGNPDKGKLIGKLRETILSTEKQ